MYVLFKGNVTLCDMLCYVILCYVVFSLGNLDRIKLPIQASPVFPLSHTAATFHQNSIDLCLKYVFSLGNLDRIKVAIQASPVFPLSHTAATFHQNSVDLC